MSKGHMEILEKLVEKQSGEVTTLSKLIQDQSKEIFLLNNKLTAFQERTEQVEKTTKELVNSTFVYE